MPIKITKQKIDKKNVIQAISNPKSVEVIIKSKKNKSKVIKSNKKPNWVIRAAQTGSALIYNKNTREMKSIEIGDSVVGLGKIKSIKSTDGVWVILGSLGKLEQ